MRAAGAVVLDFKKINGMSRICSLRRLGAAEPRVSAIWRPRRFADVSQMFHHHTLRVRYFVAWSHRVSVASIRIYDSDAWGGRGSGQFDSIRPPPPVAREQAGDRCAAIPVAPAPNVPKALDRGHVRCRSMRCSMKVRLPRTDTGRLSTTSAVKLSSPTVFLFSRSR